MPERPGSRMGSRSFASAGSRTGSLREPIPNRLRSASPWSRGTRSGAGWSPGRLVAAVRPGTRKTGVPPGGGNGDQTTDMGLPAFSDGNAAASVTGIGDCGRRMAITSAGSSTASAMEGWSQARTAASCVSDSSIHRRSAAKWASS